MIPFINTPFYLHLSVGKNRKFTNTHKDKETENKVHEQKIDNKNAI